MSFHCTRYTLYKKTKTKKQDLKKKNKKQTKRADPPPTGGKNGKKLKYGKEKKQVSKLKNVTAIPFHAS